MVQPCENLILLLLLFFLQLIFFFHFWGHLDLQILVQFMLPEDHMAISVDHIAQGIHQVAPFIDQPPFVVYQLPPGVLPNDEVVVRVHFKVAYQLV